MRVQSDDDHYDAYGRIPGRELTMFRHLALPAGAKRGPAELLGPEGMGLSDLERRRADLSPNWATSRSPPTFTGGAVWLTSEEMLARCMPLLAEPERMRGIGHAALDVLRAEPRTDPDRLAAVGYGTGGANGLELGRGGVSLRAIGTVDGLSTAGPVKADRVPAQCGPGSGRKTRSCRPRNGTRSPLRCRPQASTGASRSTAAPCTPSTTRRSPRRGSRCRLPLTARTASLRDVLDLLAECLPVTE